MKSFDINKLLERLAEQCVSFVHGRFGINVTFEASYRIVVIGIAAVITLVFCLLSETVRDSSNLADGNIIRPSDSQGQIVLNINASADEEEESHSFDVVVNPRKLTKEEAADNFTKAYGYIFENMAGENSSLENVSSDLNLMTELPEYKVLVEWYSDNYETVNFDGRVDVGNVAENGENVQLTAIMKCGEYEAEYTFDIKVVKPEFTGSKGLWSSVDSAVNKVLSDNEYSDKVELPSDVDGHRIRYSQDEKSSTPLIAAGGVAAALAVIAAREDQKRKTLKARKKQLQYDYSEVVSKLTLLIGAGMSVQRAWEKIAFDYRKKRQKDIRFAYEEMLTTVRCIQAGVSEKTAYREFGRRCDTKEYRKLGTLLEQNVRKGTKGLSELLEQESAEAFEQRKNLARQMGEEAGTKLLLPMILMLMIVMVIVMVPAVMSFQM